MGLLTNRPQLLPTEDDAITLTQQFQSYIISTGTLDADDLMFHCLGFVSRTDIAMDHADLEILSILERKLADVVYYGDPEVDQKKRMGLLIDRIFPLMKRVAPPGCFFGIHPGDPGRIGFWPDSLRFNPA